MARKTNTKYLSNVLKSIKYATIETVAEMNPVIVETYKENKDFFKDTLEQLQEKQQSAGTKVGDAKSFIKDTYSNLKSDLSTGKFYNKERMTAVEDENMSKIIGFDFNDMGLDDAFEEGGDDDWDIDFGDDDDSSSSPSSSSNDSNSSYYEDPLVAKAMKGTMICTTSAINKASRRSTSILGGTMIETAKFNADVIVRSAEKMMNGFYTSNALLHKDLTAMNQNIAGMVEFTNEALRTHIENSATFYETQKNQMQEQTELLKEIVDIQKSVYQPEKKRSDRTTISDIFNANGSINLSSYRDYIKQNGSGGGTLGMLGMVNEYLPLLTGDVKGSPLAIPLRRAIKKMIPEAVKDMSESLNETVVGMMSTALVNLTQAKSGKNGDFFKTLGDLLGLSVPELGKMSVSNYEKGTVSWTGKDHKALTEVIPKYLSDIYSAVSGNQPTRFDYNTGKYMTREQIQKQYQREFNSAVGMANADVNRELIKQLNAMKLSNDDQRKEVLNAIEKIQSYNFKQMKNFNPNSKRSEDLDPKTYGITGPNADAVMEIVRAMYGKVDKRVQLRASSSLLNNVSRYNDTLREAEASGDSVFNVLFDGSVPESKIIDTPIMASAKRLDTTNELLSSILSAIEGGSGRRRGRHSYKRTKSSTTQQQQTQNATTPTGDQVLFENPSEFIEALNEEERLKEEREKVVEESYIESIENATTASDKLKAFFNGFSLLTKKPIAFLKGALTTVDTYAYSLFFGNGEEDAKSISDKIFKGFDSLFNKIGNSVSGVFKSVKEEIVKEGKTTANDLFKAIFGIDFKSFGSDLKKSLFGNEDASFLSGMGSLLGKGMKEIFSDVKTNIKSSLSDFFDSDTEAKRSTIYNATAGKVVSKYNEQQDKAKVEADRQKILREGSDSIYDVIQNAAMGKKVTKSGIIAVSEGERIIPGDMSPESIDRRKIQEKTAIDKFKRATGLGDIEVESFATGGKVGGKKKKKNSKKLTYRSNMTYESFNKFYETLETDEEKERYTKQFAHDFATRKAKEALNKGQETADSVREYVDGKMKKIKDKNPALADAINREVNGFIQSERMQKIREGVRKGASSARSYAGQVKDTVKGAYQTTKDAFFDQDDEFTRAFTKLAGHFMPDKDDSKAVVDDIAKNWKNYLPKTLASGALGAGVSLVTGMVGGPLLGAAVGSAIGLTTKSDAIQKMLFGDKLFDEEGNVIGRAGAMFSKDIATAIQKYAPDMAKSGLAGAALSIMPFIPGGPVAGLLVGSTLGYMKNNQELQNTLFGTTETLKSMGKYVKKQLPAMGLGAMAGAVAGPFGLTTNLLIGSTLGLVSDTERFKEMIFGYKGLDGKRAGGLVGMIKSILTPPLEGLNNLLEESRTFFKEEVFDPLKQAFKPMIQSIENVFNRIGDTIADSISTHITRPIGNMIADRIIVPIEKKVLGPIIKFGLGLGKKVIRTAISPISRFGKSLERRQLSRAGYAGGTATERILRRQELGDQFDEDAEGVFSPLSRIPGLEDSVFTRRGRHRKRAQRYREGFEQANMLDEFVTGNDLDTVREALLLNRSAGAGAIYKKHGIKKFAESVYASSNLPSVLNNLLSKRKLEPKIVKSIENEVRKGEYSVSVKIIKDNSPLLDEDERKQLIKLIKETAGKVKEGFEKAANANQAIQKFKEEHNGLDITGNAARRVLEQELRRRGMSMEEVAGVRPENLEEQEYETTPIGKKLKSISDDVHTIADILTRKMNGEIFMGSTVEEAAATNDVQYQYTENGMVRITRNEQGELEPDDQDSETRETLRRRDEQDETQKGILGKLSEIGTSLINFFKGDNEEQKPSLLSKILSLLGVGFSAIGGSKIFKAAKWILGGSIGAYALSKFTEKDENGESMASKIGDTVSTAFGGVWDNARTWFTDSVKPWFAEEFFPGVASGLGSALEIALDSGGWLAERLAEFTVEFIPQLAVSIAKEIWDKITGFFSGKFGKEKMDEKDITGNNNGYKSGETKDNKNIQLETSVPKNTDYQVSEQVQNIDGTVSYDRTENAKLQEVKNSIAFKNTTPERQQRILDSNIVDVWDNPSPIEGYTVGDLASTPGVEMFTDKNGRVIYSEELFSQDYITKTMLSNNDIGDTGYKVNSVTEDERTEKTGVTNTEMESNKFNQFGNFMVRNTFTKGRLPMGALTKVANASNAVSNIFAGASRIVPFVGKAASGIFKINAAASAAPVTAGKIISTTKRNLQAGNGIFKSFTGAVRDTEAISDIGKSARKKAGSVKKIYDKLTKKTRIEEIVDVSGNVIETVTSFDGQTKFGKVLSKISEILTKVLTDNKVADTIRKILNGGISILKKGKEVTTGAIKKGLTALVTKIIKMLPDAVGDQITRIGAKLSGYAATGGLQLAAQFALDLASGFKNADANLEVGYGNVSIGERLISTIAQAISGTLLFGIVPAHMILSLATDLLDLMGVDLEDLRERQEEMKEIVAQYNDEYDTNYSVYDFIMDEKIETKIMKGLAKIGGTAWGGLKTIGKALDTGFYALGGAAGNLLGNIFIDSDKYGLDNYTDNLAKKAKGTADEAKETYDIATGANDNPSTKDYYKNYMAEKENNPDLLENKVPTVDEILKTETGTGMSLLDTAQEKTVENLASAAGVTTDQFLSDTDLSTESTGITTMNNINSGWESFNASFTPLIDAMSNNGDMIANNVSKNIAVALGLADAKEDITMEEILKDPKYLEVRRQLIQDNSYIAAVSAGMTGSNSNNPVAQDSAARKTLYSGNSSSKLRTSLISSNLNGGSKGTLYSDYLAGTMAGSGSGLNTIKDIGDENPAETNFVSQKFGRYANMTFGKGQERQKVSEAGCAPATAMMAINSNLGQSSPLEMNDALKTASGYISSTGGVTADYFADEFGKYGFKTAYVSRSDKNQKKILMHQLNNGRSIVLMGKSKSNTSKNKSPFGPTYHYVVATGLSKDGKYVYINDPEASEPNKRYPVDEIFNNSDLSIIPIKSEKRIGKLANKLQAKLKNLSGKATPGIIFVGDSRVIQLKAAVGENGRTRYLGQSSADYAWLSTKADASVKGLAKTYPDYFIVFNCGLNDLSGISSYVNYYKELLKDGDLKNKIRILSINPVDEEKCKTIKNENIHKFNTRLKAINEDIFIDTCTQMEKDGFDHTGNGIQYTKEQYKKIYEMVVNALDGQSLTESSDSTITTSGSTRHIRTISGLISAIGEILSGSYGLTSSDASSLTSSSSGTALNSDGTIDTSKYTGKVSSNSAVAKKQKELVATMESKLGQLKYAQNNAKYPGSRNPEDGSGDCSSTVQWAYKKVTGIDIGDWTGAQEDSNTTTRVDGPQLSRAFDESKLQLGDIMLYGSNGSSHVEMYYGPGQTIGHGSGYGPKIKSIGYRTNDCWSAKRLNDYMAGKGSGLFVSQKSSEWATKRIGDESVSVAGCAPAVATMAINNDEKYNMNTAIKDAKQYKLEGGGVTADYFADVFKKQGYDTIVLKDKDRIIELIDKGYRAILIGIDANNKSKMRSPFGASPHYVLATGISEDKKYIIVNDPEADMPDAKYKVDILMRGVTAAIIPVAKKGNKISTMSNELRSALSNISGGATTAEIIDKAVQWAYRRMNRPAKISYSAAGFVNTAYQYAGVTPTTIKTADAIKTNYTKYGFSNVTSKVKFTSGDGLQKGDVLVGNGYAALCVGPKRLICTRVGFNKMGGTKIEVVNYWNYPWNCIFRYDKNAKSNTTEASSNTSTTDTNTTEETTTTDTTTTTDSTTLETTASTVETSEPTFLDKLTEAFAKLASGWGICDLESDTGTTSGSSTSSIDGTSSTTVSGGNGKEMVWNYLKAKGIPEKGIAGFMGNVQAESEHDFMLIEGDLQHSTPSKTYTEQVDKGTVSRDAFVNNQSPRSKWPVVNGKQYGPGYGLTQWTYHTRKAGLYDLAKQRNVSIADPQLQLDYNWTELQGYPNVLNSMKSGSSIRNVSDIVLTQFERPADQSEAVKQKRAGYGESIYKEFAGKGSGLALSGISNNSSKTIRSINRANRDKTTIPKEVNLGNVLGGRGTELVTNNKYTSSPSSTPTYAYTQARTNQLIVANSNNNTVDTNTLLKAIINLLSQEVKNTAFIEGIADAIVSLVDAKANSTEDVSTKKQLLDTKAQILSLVRQQNVNSTSTSLNDLITSMESITTQ